EACGRDARAPLRRCATIDAMRALSSVGGPLQPAWLIVLAWGGACAAKAEAVQPLLVPQAPGARSDPAASVPKAASVEEKTPARASAFEREFKSAVASYDAKNYEQARKQLEP